MFLQCVQCLLLDLLLNKVKDHRDPKKRGVCDSEAHLFVTGLHNK